MRRWCLVFPCWGPTVRGVAIPSATPVRLAAIRSLSTAVQAMWGSDRPWKLFVVCPPDGKLSLSSLESQELRISSALIEPPSGADTSSILSFSSEVRVPMNKLPKIRDLCGDVSSVWLLGHVNAVAESRLRTALLRNELGTVICRISDVVPLAARPLPALLKESPARSGGTSGGTSGGLTPKRSLDDLLRTAEIACRLTTPANWTKHVLRDQPADVRETLQKTVNVVSSMVGEVPSFLLRSAAQAMHPTCRNTQTIACDQKGRPFVLEGGERIDPNQAICRPTLFFGCERLFKHILPLCDGQFHYTLNRAALDYSCGTDATSPFQHIVARSAWHQSDETLAKAPRPLSPGQYRMGSPMAVYPTSVVAADSSARTSDVSVIVLSLALTNAKKFSLRGDRLYPPANSSISRNEIGRTVTFHHFSREAQWIPHEVSALAELKLEFCSGQEALSWAVTDLVDTLRRVAAARRDESGNHRHKLLLVLTGIDQPPGLLEFLEAMISKAVLGEGNVIRRELSTQQFSVGWTTDKLFWPNCIGRGYSALLRDNWQRTFVGKVTASELKQTLLDFEPTNPVRTLDPVALAAEIVSSGEAGGAGNNKCKADLEEYVRKLWSPLSCSSENFAREQLTFNFAICTVVKEENGKGERRHVRYFCKGTECTSDASSLKDAKLLVMLDAKDCLTRTGLDAELNSCLAAGLRVWCVTYAHHLLSGLGCGRVRPTVQQLENLYSSAAGMETHNGDEVKRLASIFIGQTAIASLGMQQLRIVAARMPMVLAAVCMEHCGLKVLPKEAQEKALNAKNITREKQAAALGELVHPQFRSKWNYRSISDVGALLFGGLLPKIIPRATPALTMNAQRSRTTWRDELFAAQFGDVSPPATATLKKKLKLTENTRVVVVSVVLKAPFVSALSVYFVDNDTRIEFPIASEGPRAPTQYTLHSALRTLSLHAASRELQEWRGAATKPSATRHTLVVVLQGPTSEHIAHTIGLVDVIAGKADASPGGVTVVAGAAVLASGGTGTSFEDDFADLVTVARSDEMRAGNIWIAAMMPGTDGKPQTIQAQKLFFFEKLAMTARHAVGGTTTDPFETRVMPEQPVSGQDDSVPQFFYELPGLISHFSAEEQKQVLDRAYRSNSLSLDVASFEHLLNFTKSRMNRVPSAPRSVEDDAADKRLVEAVEAVLSLRTLEKLIGSDHLSRSNSDTNLVHAQIDMFGTATGRISSMRPNIHNIPAEKVIRDCFVSRFGNDGLLVELDYSQLEVTILAVLSGDPKMIEAIQNKVDFHAARVGLMRREPYEQVLAKVLAKDPEYVELRQKAKVFSFQRQYGAGVRTIAEHSGLSVEEISALIEREEALYSGVVAYVALVSYALTHLRPLVMSLRTRENLLPKKALAAAAAMEPHHYFQLPTGTKLSISEAYGPFVRNYPIQGFAAEVVQIVVGRVNELLLSTRNMNNRAFLVNTVHDSIWLDVHREVSAEVITSVRRIMEGAPEMMSKLFPDLKFDVPLPVSVKLGPSLGLMEDLPRRDIDEKRPPTTGVVKRESTIVSS